MYKKIIPIVICVVGSISATNYLLTYDLTSDIHHGGFWRNYEADVTIVQQAAKSFPGTDLYIAGISNNAIDIGRYDWLQQIQTFNFDLTKSFLRPSHVSATQIAVADTSPKGTHAVRVITDSLDSYVIDKMTPLLYQQRSDQDQNIFEEKISFNQAMVIPSQSFILNTYDTETKSSRLTLLPLKNTGTQRKYYYLKKQVDGLFCCRGHMAYDQKTQQIVYLFKHRNEFICFDTAFNFLQECRTIDTVRTAPVKTVEVKSSHKILLSPNAVTVNNLCTAADGYLYVDSGIKSAHEPGDLEKNVMIDIYSLTQHAYCYSFYLPRYQNLALTEFRVYQNLLIAIYNQHLVVYKITFTGETPA